MMILRLGDIPLDQNTDSGVRSCGEETDGESISLINCPDTIWVYAFGWTLCIVGLLIFLIAAFHELFGQIDYGLWNVRYQFKTPYYQITDKDKKLGNKF